MPGPPSPKPLPLPGLPTASPDADLCLGISGLASGTEGSLRLCQDMEGNENPISQGSCSLCSRSTGLNSPLPQFMPA